MAKTLWIVLLLWQGITVAEVIRDYRPVEKRLCSTIGNEEWALLRRFDIGKEACALAVDTRTLQTKILQDPKNAKACLPDSRYFRLLRLAGSPPYPLQDDGITHGKHGLYLTTDLCPSSKKGFEARLYEAIIHRFPHPVPVTLFVTKRWIDKHPAAFERLRRWESEDSLAITWGNHTAWHHYHPGKPLQENFVLSPEEDLRADILTLEKALLSRGIVPSVFFRFPGLVSDERSIKTIQRLGLVTIGTDAWLAKGQLPKEGSIMLVHGNKNEAVGVDRLLKMLRRGEIKRLSPLTRIEENRLDGRIPSK